MSEDRPQSPAGPSLGLAVVVLALVATTVAPAATGAQALELEVDAPDAVDPGQEFAVTFEVTNAGSTSTNATGLRLTDYPASVEVIEISTNGTTAEQRDSVFWTEPLGPGETVTATFRFRLDAGTTAESVEVGVLAGTDRHETRRTVAVAVDRNEPPRPAVALADEPVAGETVTLSAANSTDPDGRIVGYRWDVDGDGTAEGTGEELTHTFQEAGTATVNLTVIDDEGGTNSTTVEVVVGPRTTPTGEPGGNGPATGGPGDGGAVPRSPTTLGLILLAGFAVAIWVWY